MTDLLHDLSAPALVRAIRANFYEFFRLAALSGEHPKFPQGVRWCSTVPHPWFRGVLVSRPVTPENAGVIQDQVQFFQSKGVTKFSWWQDTSLPEGSWDQALEAEGFSASEGPPGMALDLNDLPTELQIPLGLEICVVEDPEALEVYTRTLCRGFEFPDSWETPLLDFFTALGVALPIRHYLGFLSGEPVATATLFLGAGVAGIYNVGTIPEARRCGIGTALTLQPMYEARKMGYRAGILHATPDGYGVYERIGFQKLCEMELHLWSAEEDG